MSITDNTQGLEEVLEMARSLPDAGSGGSSADLVIRVNQHGHNTTVSAGNIEIVSGNLMSVIESILSDSGKCVKVEVENYKYSDGGYIVDCSVVNGKAHFYAEWFMVYWTLPIGNYTLVHQASWNMNTGAIDFVNTYRYESV